PAAPGQRDHRPPPRGLLPRRLRPRPAARPLAPGRQEGSQPVNGSSRWLSPGALRDARTGVAVWSGEPGTAVRRWSRSPAPGSRYAKMSVLGTFHPDTLTTAVAPCRSAEFQVTVSVCDSPGDSVMSLLRHSEDCSSLSPGSSWPPAVPRRTSARSKNATVDGEVLVRVTVVARSAPAGPGWLTVLAVAVIEDCGSVCRPVRFAYCEI